MAIKTGLDSREIVECRFRATVNTLDSFTAEVSHYMTIMIRPCDTFTFFYSTVDFENRSPPRHTRSLSQRPTAIAPS